MPINPAPGIELISCPSWVPVQKTLEGPNRIKGFMSLNSKDRSADISPPESFNIARFMGNPVVMYNHQFWKDENGNGITVGKVLNMYMCEVVDSGKEGMWGVKNSTNGLVEDEFPKDKSPDIRIGSKGVFTHVEVTVNEIWNKIEKGELSGFSWRGLAKVDTLTENGETSRVFKNIDLVELSIVPVPNHQAGLFVINKNLNELVDLNTLIAIAKELQPLVVQSLHFPRGKWDKERALSWMKERGYTVDVELELSDKFIYPQKDFTIFDENSLVSVQISDGVQAVVGNLKVFGGGSGSISRKLEEKELNELRPVKAELKESGNMAEQVKTEIKKCGDVPQNELVDTIVNKMAEKFEPVLKSLSENIVKSTSVLEGITTQQGAINKSLTELVAKSGVVTAPAAPAVPAAPAASAGDVAMGEVVKGLKEATSQLETISKSLLNTGTERVENPKKEEVVKDKLDIFDNVMPFGKGK